MPAILERKYSQPQFYRTDNTNYSPFNRETGYSNGDSFKQWNCFDTSSATSTKLAKSKIQKNQEGETQLEIGISRTIEIAIGDSIIEIANELSEIASTINESKRILDLQNDWDSEGALSVEPFVWERAVNTLLIYSQWILVNKGIILTTPTIDAIADGSIDIMWSGSKARLLLNVRSSNPSEAHYYGDTYEGKNKFKGAIDLAEVQDFFAYWLVDFLK